MKRTIKLLPVVIICSCSLVVGKPIVSKMYWVDSSQDAVLRADLDGTDYEVLVSGLSAPFGIAVDQVNEYIFWSDNITDSIYRADLEGTNVHRIVTGLVTPNHIAVDSLNGMVYWTDRGAGKLQRARLNGTGVEDLITGLISPRGVDLDVAAGHVYFVDTSGSIYRSNLDGTSMVKLPLGTLNYPFCMALDTTNDKIYWAEISYDVIRRANIDGSGVQNIVTSGLSAVTGMDIDHYGKKLYFTDFHMDKIFRCNLDGSSFEPVLATGALPNDIALYLIPEPCAPPVADADGPYTSYVDDTLTLDASGSTDDDNDIVSYMWDLDDDGAFETDAGGEAIFDVNYMYLQSLGLLVDYKYNIHLRVTDSEGQSDVADSTLIIVPNPALEVALDIKPGTCPNPVNVKSKGVLPIAILGTLDYDVTTIDPTSVRLAGVEPLRSGYEDVATPVDDTNDCNCTEAGPDGFLDLTLKFKTQRIVEAVGDVNDGDVFELPLSGVLYDETPIEGADCILIRGRHKPINPADINRDGVVNAADFAIFAQNWLQSSIVDE